jgi:hypothetical protein
MQDFEKLGQFYLGRIHNAEQTGSSGDLLLYDSNDLNAQLRAETDAV